MRLERLAAWIERAQDTVPQTKHGVAGFYKIRLYGDGSGYLLDHQDQTVQVWGNIQELKEIIRTDERESY